MIIKTFYIGIKNDMILQKSEITFVSKETKAVAGAMKVCFVFENNITFIQWNHFFIVGAWTGFRANPKKHGRPKTEE